MLLIFFSFFFQSFYQLASQNYEKKVREFDDTSCICEKIGQNLFLSIFFFINHVYYKFYSIFLAISITKSSNSNGWRLFLFFFYLKKRQLCNSIFVMNFLKIFIILNYIIFIILNFILIIKIPIRCPLPKFLDYNIFFFFSYNENL